MMLVCGLWGCEYSEKVVGESDFGIAFKKEKERWVLSKRFPP